MVGSAGCVTESYTESFEMSEEIIWQKTLTNDEAHELLMSRQLEKKQKLIDRLTRTTPKLRSPGYGITYVWDGVNMYKPRFNMIVDHVGFTDIVVWPIKSFEETFFDVEF